MPKAQSNQRWYPSKEQLKPENLEGSFRQLLKQHYDLQDQVTGMREQLSQPAGRIKSGPPPGSGPTDTMLLGLRVVPVDVQTLADGTKLTFDKKNGNFTFK